MNTPVHNAHAKAVHAPFIAIISKSWLSAKSLFLMLKIVNGTQMQRFGQAIENKQKRPFIKSFTNGGCERPLNGERSL